MLLSVPYERRRPGVMIEKFAGAGGKAVSEFLDLNHTQDHKPASALSIAKFVQCSPRGPTNFAIGTLERAMHLWRSHPSKSHAAEAKLRREIP
jgi:hypothetical protein